MKIMARRRKIVKYSFSGAEDFDFKGLKNN